LAGIAIVAPKRDDVEIADLPSSRVVNIVAVDRNDLGIALGRGARREVT
jgi:hypothetical protein